MLVQSTRLMALLQDTDTAALVHVAQQFGLKRVPGLSRQNLINRLLSRLPPDQHADLTDHLIAVHFGRLSFDELLTRLLAAIPYDEVPVSPPRMDRIAPQQAIVLDSGPPRWAFTMRGHDVMVDLAVRHVGCDCRHFEFASRYGALCKHIATGLQIIPRTYARSALIDLLLQQRYPSDDTQPWHFITL